jgi:hypothetical protein
MRFQIFLCRPELPCAPSAEMEDLEGRIPHATRQNGMKTLCRAKIYPTDLTPPYDAPVPTREISKSSETLECADTVGVIAFGE